MGLHRVAQTMKRRGIRSGRTWRGKIGFASNKCVKTVVFRDTYFTGKLSPQRGWMPGFTVDVPPLVSEDLAREARRVLSSSPPPIRRTAHPFLVRGLTRCAHCDLKMGAQAAAAWKYAYYRCRRGDIQPLNQPRCPGRGVRAELVDRMVWDEVCRLIREPGALAHEVEQLVAENEREAESPATALREIDAALEALKQERGRVLRLVRRGLMTDEEVASELDDIRRQQAPLEQRRELVLISRRSKLDRDSRVRVVEDRLAAMRGALDSLTFEQRRAVVMDLVDEVKIDTINKTVQITGIALAPATGSGTDSGSDDHGAAPRGGADGVKPSTAFYGTGMSTTAHHRLVHQGDLALHRRPDGGLEVERWSGRTDAWSPPHVGLERAAR